MAVDWVRSWRKIPMWLRGTNFCINCNSSPRFASSFMQLRNDPKCTQTLWNTPKHKFRLQWGVQVRCCKKSRRNFVARTFAIIAPVLYVLHQVLCSYETFSNAPKYYKTDRNLSLGSNGVDWVRSLRKIPMWLRDTNCFFNCSCSPCMHRVSCSYETIPNAPKHYQTH